MAKNVRWRVPFVSLNGTRYKVEIYDEGYAGPVTELQGGASVFKTDDNSSDDFFEPVRTSTGILQVVDPDGKLMDELAPDNNTHRFVRLVDIGRNKVAWQGFLNSEIYTQTYDENTQVIEASVNSVLEAMDSEQLDTDQAAKFQYIRYAIAYVLRTMTEAVGVTLFERLYFPAYAMPILTKYVNMTTFFDKKQQCNADAVSYVLSGISKKEMLFRICQFMGWVLKEDGQNLYFIAPDEMARGFRSISYQDFIRGLGGTAFSTVNYQTTEMKNLTWRGIGHNKSAKQGAKSVEVIANLSDFTMNLEVPECPLSDTTEAAKMLIDNLAGRRQYVSMMFNKNQEAYSNIQFNYQKSRIRVNITGGTTEDSDLVSAINDSAWSNGFIEQATINRGNQYTLTPGAFLVKSAVDEENISDPKMESGLYCTFLPQSILINTFSRQLKPLVTIDNVIPNTITEGFLAIQFRSEYLIYRTGGFSTRRYDSVLDGTIPAKIALFLKFGDKYWHETTKEWTTSFDCFEVETDGAGLKSNWDKSMDIRETEGFLIPCSEPLSGVIQLGIMPMMVGQFCEINIRSLSVENVLKHNSRRIERKENHYFKLLGVNFSDKKLIDCQLGSDLNNLPSPSLIMENMDTPITSLTYTNPDGTTGQKRPEVELLDRAGEYYKKARRILNLEVERDNDRTYPVEKMTGLDGKTYDVLGESVDWATDVSTITCFEVPEE